MTYESDCFLYCDDVESWRIVLMHIAAALNRADFAIVIVRQTEGGGSTAIEQAAKGRQCRTLVLVCKGPISPFGTEIAYAWARTNSWRRVLIVTLGPHLPMDGTYFPLGGDQWISATDEEMQVAMQRIDAFIRIWHFADAGGFLKNDVSLDRSASSVTTTSPVPAPTMARSEGFPTRIGPDLLTRVRSSLDLLANAKRRLHLLFGAWSGSIFRRISKRVAETDTAPTPEMPADNVIDDVQFRVIARADLVAGQADEVQIWAH